MVSAAPCPPQLTTTAPAPRWWMLLLLASLAVGVYANSIPNGFAYDDCGIIQGNHFVNNLEWAEIWHSNYWPATEGPGDLLYRPLTIFSYLANHALNPEPWTFHLVNVLLHGLVTVLATILTWRLLRNRWMALLAGALFAIHPLHTEVVANVVGRAELLAALWSLLALLIFLPDRDALAGPPATRAWWHGLLVAACFFAALLAKETPAALLGAILFLDLWRWAQWPAGRPTLWAWLGRQCLRYHLPLWAAFGGYLALRLNAIGLRMDPRSFHPLVNPLSTANLLERIVTPFLLLAKYILLMFWPAVLSADYSAPSIMPTSNIFQPLPLLGLLITATTAAAIISYWKHSPRLVAVLVLFASSYLLVGNLIRIGTIFGERLFYWPSVFFLMLAAYLIVRTYDRLTRIFPTALGARWARVAAGLVVAAALVAGSVRTIIRNPDWHNNLALALATAQANPQSAKACEWAGSVLLSQTKEKWMQEFGQSLLQRATDLYPDMGLAYWELSKYYFRQQRIADGVRQLALAARYHAGKLETREGLKYVDLELQKHPPAEYTPALEEALAREPRSATAHFAYALALRAQHKFPLAQTHFAQTLECDPCFFEAGAELGLVKGRLGDFPAAVALLRRYVLTMRFNGIARCDLAGALLQLDPAAYPDAWREAQMNVERAHALLPDDPQVRDLMKLVARKKPPLISNAALGAKPAAPSGKHL